MDPQATVATTLSLDMSSFPLLPLHAILFLPSELLVLSQEALPSLLMTQDNEPALTGYVVRQHDLCNRVLRGRGIDASVLPPIALLPAVDVASTPICVDEANSLIQANQRDPSESEHGITRSPHDEPIDMATEQPMIPITDEATFDCVVECASTANALTGARVLDRDSLGVCPAAPVTAEKPASRRKARAWEINPSDFTLFDREARRKQQQADSAATAQARIRRPGLGELFRGKSTSALGLDRGSHTVIHTMPLGPVGQATGPITRPASGSFGDAAPGSAALPPAMPEQAPGKQELAVQPSTVILLVQSVTTRRQLLP